MRISLCLVNWNGKDDTLKCLTSLRAQTHTNWQAVLVDNGSTDGSVAAVRERFPEVQLVALPDNMGFATATNIAAQNADGELLFVVNTDTEFQPDLLQTLERAAEDYPDYGIFSCQMVQMHNRERVDCKGLAFYPTLHARMLGINDAVDTKAVPSELVGATGGAMLIRREVYETLGLFDDAFFFNNEDVDFALRAFGAGIKTLYLPQAVVYHRRSPNEKRMPDLVMYYIQRNMELAAIKNVPLAAWLALGPLHGAYNLLQLGKWAAKGKARLFLRAKRDALKLARQLERTPMRPAQFLKLLVSAGLQRPGSKR